MDPAFVLASAFGIYVSPPADNAASRYAALARESPLAVTQTPQPPSRPQAMFAFLKFEVFKFFIRPAVTNALCILDFADGDVEGQQHQEEQRGAGPGKHTFEG